MRRRPFPPVLTEARLQEYAGEYISDELRVALPGLRREGPSGRPHEDRPRGFHLPLRPRPIHAVPARPGRFTIDFIRGPRNAIVGFELSTDRMKGVSFVKK